MGQEKELDGDLELRLEKPVLGVPAGTRSTRLPGRLDTINRVLIALILTRLQRRREISMSVLVARSHTHTHTYICV